MALRFGKNRHDIFDDSPDYDDVVSGGPRIKGTGSYEDVITGAPRIRGNIVGWDETDERIMRENLRAVRGVAPARSAVAHRYNYSDFGLENSGGSYGSAGAGAYSGYDETDEGTFSRPGVAETIIRVALGKMWLALCAALFLFAARMYEIEAVLTIPVVLAAVIWLSYSIGLAAKMRISSGAPTWAALLGAALGTLLMGGLLFAAAFFLFLAPASALIHIWGLPHEASPIFFAIDDSVNYIFRTFNMFGYVVIPGIGTILGLVPGRGR